jgi:glycosyltransferase involved in cell wall biosynthesis
VHDLIPLTHPEYCRPGESERHASRMHAVLRSAAGILAISQGTMDQLREHAERQGLPMPPATVALLAPASLQAGADTLRPIAAPYFVMLGTIEPRKNHLMLLQVWRHLAERLGEAAPHLVLIGQRGWECENVVDLLERCPGLRGLVHELPQCGDAQLARYLAHARALLFPSFAEGYGMPLAEAYSQWACRWWPATWRCSRRSQATPPITCLPWTAWGGPRPCWTMPRRRARAANANCSA